MRWPAILCLVLFCCDSVLAQDQEHSLIDRLLRPNMELRNRAQNKAFTADSKVVGHQGTVETFVVEQGAKQKVFGDAHTATTKEYTSGSGKADVRQRSVLQARNVDTRSQLATSPARDVRGAYDARLAVSGRNFSENERVFREQGKSQKSLDRQNPTLTIDQVRELLNKSK